MAASKKLPDHVEEQRDHVNAVKCHVKLLSS